MYFAVLVCFVFMGGLCLQAPSRIRRPACSSGIHLEGTQKVVTQALSFVVRKCMCYQQSGGGCRCERAVANQISSSLSFSFPSASLIYIDQRSEPRNLIVAHLQ